ncbi:MAG: hypothetical protein JWL84_3759, partial [Rhodospirillales bacterium]|nr:hypothetical protein [Rhodospirillales bacterium]
RKLMEAADPAAAKERHRQAALKAWETIRRQK